MHLMVAGIGSYAFDGCSSLQSFVIPERVTTISDYAFRNCTSLSEIQLPNSLTTIGSNAFDNCFNLYSLVIPENITTISDNAFYDCCNLIEIYNNSSLILTVGDENYGYVAYYAKYIYNKEDLTTTPYPTHIQQIGDVLYYVDDTNGDFIALKLVEGNTNSDIKLDDKTTEIYRKAFYNNKNLESITLPKNLKEIGDDAFKGCENLLGVINYSTLTINTGEDLNGYVAYYASIVYNCDENSKVSFETNNNVLYLVDNTLNQFYAIKIVDKTVDNVSFDERTVYLGANLFEGCDNLTSIDLTELTNLTIINDYIFQNFTSLESIKLPKNLESIGSYAFDGCSSLQSIIIPEGVSNIGSYAFRNCTKLEFVQV